MANPKVRLPNPTSVIYALSVDGINHRYVGYNGSGGIRKRMVMHRYQAAHQQGNALYDWMREQGIDNVICVVLEKLPDGSTVAELGEREQYWIAKLRDEGHALFNKTDGGPGNKGFRVSPETRAKLVAGSIAYHTGRPLSPEHVAKLSKIRSGKKHTKRHEFADPAKQASSGAQGAHSRWHAARGLVKPGCAYCAAVS